MTLAALRDAADALYFARVALAVPKIPPMARTPLADAERALCRVVREFGADPGTTAAHADRLKLATMVALREAREASPVDATPCDVEAALEDAREADGAIDVWKMVPRFALFCERMRFAPDVIADDLTLPVVSWMRDRERPPTIADAAQLFAAWSREASALYLRGIGLAP